MCGRASRVVVLPLAGLPCGARGEVGPSNSLRVLRTLRSNNSGQSDDEARCARPPRRCAPRHHPGARPHSASAPFRLAGGVRRWVVRGLSLKLLVLPAPSVLLRRRSRASVPEIKQQDQAGVGRVGGA